MGMPMATQGSDLEVRIRGKDELSPQFDALESRLIRFVGAVGAGIAAIRLTTAPIVAASNFERELANVRKTTGFLDSDINRLGDSLLEMSRRIDVSAVDLAKIAAAAGQQGLAGEGVEGIIQFTESVSRMSSVLDITAEDAARNIGKIANIFKIPLKEIENAVSVFNEVSNNSTAEGEELLDVVKRIGDAAGNLNLEQATALGATGLDFGQSPEVVGTAFAKVFTSLTQKSADFGRLLYKDASDATERWLADLNQDGLESFKKVLEGIRKLNVTDQQNTIVKLFGGGRIGALINKMVQDTTNSVLDRNFESAKKGAQGISALKEQATVLNTLDAQAKMALNSLTKLGIDASEALLKPLTQYAAQLNQALQGPQIKAFVADVIGAVGDTAGAVVDVVKFVAELNVNWTNFLQLGKYFIALKLAQGIGGMAASALGLSRNLQSIANETDKANKGVGGLTKTTTAAAAAQAAANSTFQASKIAQLLGYAELERAVKSYGDAQIRTEQLVRQKAQREAELKLKEQAQNQADLVAQRNKAQLNLAQGQVNNAQNKMVAAQAAADAQELAQRNAQAARVQQAEQAHAARLAQIQQEYQTRRAAIAATGTRVGLTAAQRERDEQIALQEASHARSLRGIQSYWDRQVAATQAGAARVIAAERAALDAAVRDRDLLAGRQPAKDAGAAKAAAETAKAGAAVQQTNAALNASQAALAASALGWNTFKIAVQSAGNIIRTVGGFVVNIGSKLLGALSWVTLIYSLADMFGLVDKLAPAFQKLTDFIGLTSAAKRAQKIASDQLTESLKKEEAALAALTEQYNKNREAGAAVEKPVFDSLTTQASSSGSAELRRKAITDIADIVAGAQAALDSEIGKTEAAIDTRLETLAADAAKAKAEIARIQAEAQRDALRFPPSMSKDGAALAKNYADQIASIKKGLAETEAQMASIRGESGKLSAQALSASESLKNAQDSVASLFTPDSLRLAQEYLVALGEQREKAQQLKDEYLELQAAQTARGAKTDEEKKKQDDAAAAALQALQDQNNVIEANQRAFRQMINDMLKMPGLTDTARKAYEDLFVYMGLNLKQLNGLIDLAASAPAAAKTGTKAGVRGNTKSDGDEKFNPKGTSEKEAESLARRIARARLAREKAENEASRALQEEANKQRLEADQRLYDRGLLAIKDYFTQRERIQQDNVDNDIKRRKEDLKAIAAEKPTDEAEKLKLDADRIKLQGEIAVLEKSREGIRKSNEEEQRRASEAFRTNVLQEQGKLREEGLLPEDVVERFKANLEEMNDQYKLFIAQLRTEGKDGLASALENSFNPAAAERALAPTRTAIDQEYNALDLYLGKLQALQQQGQLTSQDVTNFYNEQIDQALPKLRALYNQQVLLLGELAKTGAVGTPQYTKLQQDIEATRLQLVNLSNQQAATAQSINQGVTQSLANTLANVRLTFDGITEAARSFLLSVAQQMQTLFANNFAENIMQSLGSSGGGGFGGFVSSLLGKTGKKPTGSSGDPIYVKLKDGDLPGLSPDNVATNDQLVETMFDKVKSVFDDLPGTLGDFVDSLTSDLGGTLSGLLDGLGGIFSNIFSGAGGGGGFFSTLLSAFVMHTGGVVGAGGAARMVDPAVFANAKRYHTGGIMGLKPNEVPIIAEEGEEMITKKDPRHRDNLQSIANENAETSKGDINVYVVSPDQQPAIGPNDIVVTVTDNIARGGSIKQAIARIPR